MLVSEDVQIECSAKKPVNGEGIRMRRREKTRLPISHKLGKLRMTVACEQFYAVGCHYGCDASC